MTKRRRLDAATRRVPLGSAVFSKSRLARYLASFFEATFGGTPDRAAGFRPLAVGVVERRLDGIEQGPDAERHVLDTTVHEKAGRPSDAALEAAIDMLTHALQVDVIVHFRGVERHVEAELLGIAVQVLELQ